jgi:hypothetical protein
MKWEEVAFLCSSRHGGDHAREAPTSACVRVGVPASSSMRTPLLQSGAHHMANKFVAMIHGQEEGHFSRYCISPKQSLPDASSRINAPQGLKSLTYIQCIGKKSEEAKEHRSRTH